jgi:hypothetical protein
MELAVKYASEFGFRIIILHGISEDGGCTCSAGVNCESAGKHPRHSEWQKRATTDVEKIRKYFKEYPNSNIGIATGGKFFVLDTDRKKGGDKTLDNLEKKYGLRKKTVRVITGAGVHDYYLIPSDVKIKTGVGVLPGIDIRSDGGLVVAPGSIHVSGRKYEWAKGCSPWDIKMKLPDDWLLKRITEKDRFKKAPVVPENIEDGVRNITLTSIAGTMRRRGLGRDAILSALQTENEQRCDPPLDDSELEIIVNSIMNYTPADPATGLKWDKCMGEVLVSRIDAIETADDAFVDETLNCLALARQEDPAVYAKAKAKLKGRVNLNDLERAVKTKQVAIKGLKVVKAREEREGVKFPSLDGYEFNIPDGWNVSLENGVTKTYTSKEGLEKTLVAAFTPVIIIRRFVNLDNDSEKLELAFWRDGRWKRVTAPRAHIFNKNSLITLGNTGLPVSSNSASELISYLEDFEACNRDNVEVVKSLSRVGWTKDGDFFPFTTGDEIEFETDSTDTSKIFNSLEERGSYELWKEECLKIRRFGHIPRFIVASSFASPLLEKLSRRTFVVHIWDYSKSGKTATTKLALSVWGDPVRMIGSFFSTMVGMEKMCGALNHLPFAIDELQVLNEKKMPLESIIYSLSLMQGKFRGRRDGGLQDIPTWKNIVITTGEKAIMKDSSQDGVSTRTLEIYGKVLRDEEEASHVHVLAEKNYGFAGKEFMVKLCEKLKNEHQCLDRDFERIRNALKTNGLTSGHLDNVANVCVADYYASMMVWGESEEIAFKEAVAMGVKIIENNNLHTQIDHVDRAWDVLISWVAANRDKFGGLACAPRYGNIVNGTTYQILVKYANDILTDAGFEYSKCIQGFMERGLIKNFIEGGKPKPSAVRKVDGISCRVYAVEIPRENDEEDDLLR